jgi:hypothetical protein
MAAKSAIGMRRNAVLAELVSLLGEGFTLPTQGRDPDLLYVVQLEAIRDHLAKTKAVNVIPFAEPEPVEVEPVKKVRSGNANRNTTR